MALAEAMSYFRKGGLNYANFYLKSAFEKAVEDNWNKLLKESPLDEALKKVNEALGKVEMKNNETGEVCQLDPNSLVPDTWTTPSREHADLFYLKGKIHLSSWKDSKPDYEAAKIAFENARTVAERCRFRYLEMEALESLMTLAWLQGKEDEVNSYKNEFEEFPEKTYPEYPDLSAKYHNTLGNRYFQKAIDIMDEAEPDKKKAEHAILAAVKEYCLMLDYSMKHNQHRYNTSLQVIAARIQDLTQPSLRTLISEAEDAFLTGLKVTSALEQDTYMEEFLKALFNGAELLTQHVAKNKEDEVVARLQYQQRMFSQRGLSRKSIEINTIIRDYHIGKLKEKPQDESQLRKAVLTMYRLSYIYQYANQGTEAKESLTTARQLLGNFKNSANGLSDALRAVIDIGEATAAYRTDEFSTIERFLSGEEIHYRKRHDKYPKFAKSLRIAIEKLAKYCQTSPEENERIVFLRLLSEGCLRMGELYLLIGLPEDENSRTKELSEREKEDAHVFQEIVPLLGSEKDVKRMKSHIQQGGSNWLEYAHRLAHLAHDIHRQADSLLSIYNYWYLQRKYWDTKKYPKTEDELHLLNATVKSYCLNFTTLSRLLQEGYANGIEEHRLRFPKGQSKPKKIAQIASWLEIIEKSFDYKKPMTKKELEKKYKGFKNDEERFVLKEIISKCVRYLPELQDRLFDRSEYESPFVYSKQKMIMGDEIYSRYFIPDNFAYEKITEQLLTDKRQGELLLEHCTYREEGRAFIEAARNQDYINAGGEHSKFGFDLRKMLENYLEGLDVLVVLPFDTFEFNNYLIEIQRRMLLIPEPLAMKEMQKNLDVTWNQFPRLSKSQELKNEMYGTMQGRYIGLSVEKIYGKSEISKQL